MNYKLLITAQNKERIWNFLRDSEEHEVINF